MVNARLCETARLHEAFFYASPRHFDFLDCETYAPFTSKLKHV